MNFKIFNNYLYLSSFFLTFSLLLVSCSTVNRNKADYGENKQLGASIQTYLAENIAESDDILLKTLLAYDTTEENKGIIKEHPNTILFFFRSDVLLHKMGRNLSSKLLAEKVKKRNDVANAISVLLSLYPIDAYRLLNYFGRNEVISDEILLDIGIHCFLKIFI